MMITVMNSEKSQFWMIFMPNQMNQMKMKMNWILIFLWMKKEGTQIHSTGGNKDSHVFQYWQDLHVSI